MTVAELRDYITRRKKKSQQSKKGKNACTRSRIHIAFHRTVVRSYDGKKIEALSLNLKVKTNKQTNI